MRKTVAVWIVLALLLFAPFAGAIGAAKVKHKPGKGVFDVEKKVLKTKFAQLNTVSADFKAGKKIRPNIAKKLIRVQKGYESTTSAQIKISGNKLTLYLTDNVNSSGRWFAINKRFLDRFNVDYNFVTLRLDGKPKRPHKAMMGGERWLYFYIDHFSTRVITFDNADGYVEFESQVFNESYGNLRVIDKRLPNETVLYFNLSSEHIYYNASDGYYYVTDYSPYGNNGKIYGLTGNTLTNSTEITVNTTGEHTLSVPYYSAISNANLTVSYNNTLADAVLVNVSLNSNSLGSFTAPASTASTYTFSAVEGSVTINATNTISYSSNASINITQTKIDYDHNLTFVDGGLWFDGVNDYVEVSDSSEFNFSANTGFSFIIEENTMPNEVQMYISKRTAGYVGYALWQGTPNYLKLELINNNGVNDLKVRSAEAITGRQQLVVTYDGSKTVSGVRMYYSGKETNIVTISNTLTGDIANPSPLGIGIDETPKVVSLEGTIYELAILNRTSNASEIKLWNLTGGNTTLDEEVPLTVSDVTKSGSNYILNVSVSLPSDSQSHLIYLPASAQHAYNVVANTTDSNGNSFEIVDVGTASEASFNLTIPATLTAPAGVGYVAFQYGDELYLAGNFPATEVVNATVLNVPNSIWYASGVAVKNYITTTSTKLYFSTNATTTIRKQPNMWVAPTDHVNITLQEFSNKRVKFNAAAPGGSSVVFTFKLEPHSYYDIIVDGTHSTTKQADDEGYINFEMTGWSEHTIEIVENPTYLMQKLRIFLMSAPLAITLLIIVSIGFFALLSRVNAAEGDLATLLLLVMIAAAVMAWLAIMTLVEYAL